MQGTGNINYSLNKNDIYKIINGNTLYFLPFYYILTIISIIYIYTIKYTQYFFPERKEKYRKEEDIVHFFNSITRGSPFKILTLSEDFKKGTKDEKYIGLSNQSYLLIIIGYIIAFIIILEGLIRNLIFSIYSSVIQINPNNNPYNNPNCIGKIDDNPYISMSSNYFAILSLALIFLVPFIIPYFINFMKFDNYDIQHNTWFPYIILFLIFYPLVTIMISKAAFYKKLEIFPSLYKFIEKSDDSFVKFITNNFDFKMYAIIVFIFIIFVFCYYSLIYADFRYDFKHKSVIYLAFIFIIFIFIPILIIFFALSIIFSNNYKNDFDGDIVKNIKNNSVGGLFELIVKYNYPCFRKKN